MAKPDASKEIYSKVKGIVKTVEQKSVNYFNSRGEDIYTRFVRRMLMVLAFAAVVAVAVLCVILLVSSVAKPLTKVPSVKGLDVLDASMEIAASELGIEIDTKFDTATERYTVIDQFPKKGVTVRKGRTVKLLVSLGKDIYKAPSLVGLKREEAESLLKRLSIPYEMEEIQSDDYPLDTVQSQDVNPGAEVDRSQKLHVLVNSDVRKSEFKVQNYQKQPLDVVAKNLIAGSIKPVIDRVVTKNKDEDGVILSQSVSEGTIVPVNSDLHLQVGTYGEDDRERQMANWFIFTYVVANPGNPLSAPEDLGGEKSEASSQSAGPNIRVVMADELNQKAELFNKQSNWGENIVVVFKAFGKAKVTLIVNNSVVKEVAYE
jgi:beta-lactam-binding protein with PASTA domain